MAAISYLIHNVSALDLDPDAAGFTAVLSGHSHKPTIVKRGTVLFLNPGSAGPRRFRLPVTVAALALRSGHCQAEIVELASPHRKHTLIASDIDKPHFER